jgi:hypothetical protein
MIILLKNSVSSKILLLRNENNENIIHNKLNSRNKVFKITTDQAANMKKGFGDVLESSTDAVLVSETVVEADKVFDIIELTSELLEEQMQVIRAEETKKRAELEAEIEEWNKPSTSQPTITKYLRKEEINYLLLEDLTDELMEETNSDDESIKDAEDIDSENETTDHKVTKMLAYFPCAAHNLQLVIKDGLKLSDDYEVIIKRISHDIVAKVFN